MIDPMIAKRREHDPNPAPNGMSQRTFRHPAATRYLPL